MSYYITMEEMKFRYLVWASVVFLAVVTDSHITGISEASPTNLCVTLKAGSLYFTCALKSRLDLCSASTSYGRRVLMLRSLSWFCELTRSQLSLLVV